MDFAPFTRWIYSKELTGADDFLGGYIFLVTGESSK